MAIFLWPYAEWPQDVTWGICARRAGKLCGARSLLYRRLRLREWVHFLKHFSISTRFSRLRTAPNSKFQQKFAIFFLILTKISQIFAKFRSKFTKFSRNFAGISPEFHRNFTGISPELRPEKSPHGQHLADSAGPTAHGRPSMPN